MGPQSLWRCVASEPPIGQHTDSSLLGLIYIKVQSCTAACLQQKTILQGVAEARFVAKRVLQDFASVWATPVNLLCRLLLCHALREEWCAILLKLSSADWGIAQRTHGCCGINLDASQLVIANGLEGGRGGTNHRGRATRTWEICHTNPALSDLLGLHGEQPLHALPPPLW
jgi:hypothetical protein